MRKLLVAVVALLVSFGVMGSTHAGAYVCAPGSVLSIAEQNGAGAIPQSEMFFGFMSSVDTTVMSRVNHTGVIC
jgi:hypothetical protein